MKHITFLLYFQLNKSLIISTCLMITGTQLQGMKMGLRSLLSYQVPPSNSGLQGPPFQPVNNTYDPHEQF